MHSFPSGTATGKSLIVSVSINGSSIDSGGSDNSSQTPSMYLKLCFICGVGDCNLLKSRYAKSISSFKNDYIHFINFHFFSIVRIDLSGCFFKSSICFNILSTFSDVDSSHWQQLKIFVFPVDVKPTLGILSIIEVVLTACCYRSRGRRLLKVPRTIVWFYSLFFNFLLYVLFIISTPDHSAVGTTGQRISRYPVQFPYMVIFYFIL